jgi:hypothetical protein
MIQLTHIGETLLSEMINRSRPVRDFLAEHSLPIASVGNKVNAHSEVQLRHCGRYRFDGAHKLDVAILLGGIKSCVGLEAKLGRDRLSKAEFEKRFLKKCGISHSDSRISGSMISILEGKLPKACDRRDIIVEQQDVDYKLLPCWLLVVRKRILDVWSRSGRPELSQNCVVLSFEDFVSRYGGREPFNDLVQKLVDVDYYRDWMEES